MKNRNKFIYMISGSLMIIVVVAAIVIAYLLSPANIYSRNIAAAEKYLETGDYSKAILAYQDAIEQDPNNAEAYASLADIYISQSDTSSAIDLLKVGVARTGSDRLRYMLNMLISDETEPGDPHSGINTAETVYIDSGTVAVVGGYTYAEYSSKYGLESKQGNKDGSVTCTFKGLNADLTFANTEKQPGAVSATVVNASAMPTKVVFRNVLDLFGSGSSVTWQTLETLHLSGLRIVDHPEMGKAIEFEEKNVKITIQSDENGNISAGAANTFVPLKAEEGNLDDGNLVHVTGTVKDTDTQALIANAQLKVREGMYQTGNVLAEINSDVLGVYELSLNPGEYTFEVNADGYTPAFVTIYVSSYETTHLQDILLAKEGLNGQARIVLTWGSTPSNLDSYLVGRTDDGTLVRTDVMRRTSGNNASLDMDVSSGYGPETTTIYNLNGMYYFWVRDRGGVYTSGWENPTVTVYLPDQPAVTITMNAGVNDHLWDVFELDHGVLRIVNNGYTWDLESYYNSSY